jgi:hypothetical protein
VDTARDLWPALSFFLSPVEEAGQFFEIPALTPLVDVRRTSVDEFVLPE